MIRTYAYASIAAAVLALAGWASLSLYGAGKEAGAADCEATHARAAAAAQAEEARRETASSQASTSMLDYLAANLPAMEIRTHETVERIRTVYRDRPMPAVCQWPDRVQAELYQARQRANAAAGQL